MPYANKNQHREYQRVWVAQRRRQLSTSIRTMAQQQQLQQITNLLMRRLFDLVKRKKIKRSPPKITKRNRRMMELFRSGKTLTEIAGEYGISRERVRQVVRPYVDAEDGGFAIRRKEKEQKLAARRDARTMRLWGMKYEEYRIIIDIYGRYEGRSPIRTFEQQRKNMQVYGAVWDLSFAQWWKIWQESGKWNLRGRGIHYMMGRLDQSGPFSVDNVEIRTGTKNASRKFEHGFRFPNQLRRGALFQQIHDLLAKHKTILMG